MVKRKKAKVPAKKSEQARLNARLDPKQHAALIRIAAKLSKEREKVVSAASLIREGVDAIIKVYDK